MTLVARVVPDVTGVDKVFDYLIPSELQDAIGVGDRVRVPLHGRNVPGWVTAIGSTSEGFSDVDETKLRAVIKRLGFGPSAEIVQFAQWASHRWCGRLRAFYVAASPSTLVATLPTARYLRDQVKVAGDAAVSLAVGESRSLLVQRGPLKSPIDVMVGSALVGPTLVIVPTVIRARLFAASLKRHGFTVAVLPDEWSSAAGGVDVVIGSRTAVFARVPDLRSIVVIDEHDDSLREERTPTWHARDVAIERANQANVSCILVSALPSIAAKVWAGDRVLKSDELEMQSEWPHIQLIDRTLDERWSNSLLSSDFIAELRDHSRRIVVVLNTKGRARLLACASCKSLARCASCDAAVEIGAEGHFSCPRCSTQRPQVCMKCSSAKFLTLKPGVSKLREEIAQAAGRKINEVVEVTGGGDDAVAIDQSKMLFVGTEAALHRVHEADTVVFLDIDQELAAPRYRASEIVGSLLVHAARLVGRSDRGGKVMVQTHSIDSPVLQAMATLRIDQYLQSVSEMRSFMKLPPFGALAQLSGTNIDEVIEELQRNVFVHVSASSDGSYLVKATDWQVLADALSEVEGAKGVRLKVQVDPARV
jgi:primosomal protein N' (replication factor Y)